MTGISGGFSVAPVRQLNGNTGGGGVYYNNVNNEFTFDSAKTFVIDHPIDAANKYLVHVCLEGPEAGVYYRGKGEIINGASVVIHLPHYFCALCTGSDDTTIQTTHFPPRKQ